MARSIVAGVVYREIPNHEGYFVGSDGSFWSDWRGGTGGRRGEWKQKAGRAHVRSGHLYVHLKGKPNRLFGIHQLVLLAFIGPCPEGMECRHLNGNPKDNRLSNLKWGTRKENVADAIRHGTFVSARRRSIG